MYQVRFKDKKINILVRRFKTRLEAETFINLEACQFDGGAEKMIIKKENTKLAGDKASGKRE